jgi:hypothetical protein
MWWYKETLEDGRPVLHGPFVTEAQAQNDAAQRATEHPARVYYAAYEADGGEPDRFPRPVAHRLAGDGYVEVWNDGNTYPLT